MEFTFDTAYDQKTVTAMVRALRKTQRKKRSRRSHILGWAVIVLGTLLSSPILQTPKWISAHGSHWQLYRCCWRFLRGRILSMPPLPANARCRG